MSNALDGDGRIVMAVRSPTLWTQSVEQHLAVPPLPYKGSEATSPRNAPQGRGSCAVSSSEVGGKTVYVAKVVGLQ